MTNGEETLQSVLSEALRHGKAIAPSGLLASITAQPTSFVAFPVDNHAAFIFEEFDREFGFIRLVRNGTKTLNPDEQQRWVGLIRWLSIELRTWKKSADPLFQKLTILFIVTQSCDWDDQFWNLLPDSIGENLDLVDVLENKMANGSIKFTSREGFSVPIWEGEAVNAFKKADEESDWVVIAEKWKLFEPAIFPNIFFTQMMRCLYRYGFYHLVKASDNVRQTPIAMQMALALSIEQRLRLGIISDNLYIQFACVYQTLSDRRKPSQLSLGDQHLLTALLLKVANNDNAWQAWMEIFNRYPLRYPSLQIALGHALAEVPEAALETYVNSIDLSALTNNNRQNVAVCLHAFKEKATSARGCSMWTLAYKRWSVWRFDEANRNTNLHEVTWSVLDYAVVGYITECMDDTGRNKAINTILAQLSVVNNNWYLSITDCLTTWNRLLSEFQPYAHAVEAIRTGEDWITETKRYWPFQPSDSYLRAMFSNE